MDSIISLLTPKKITAFLLDISTVRQALEKFDAHKYSVVPLVDLEGHYVGTLSEGDILRFIKNQSNFNIKLAENMLVRDIDHYRPYQAVKVDALISEVFALSLEQNFIPVVDDNGVYIGIITRKEVIKHLSEKIDFKYKD